MNLTIPILVEETKQADSSTPLYGVTPLLANGPMGRGEHLSRAISHSAHQLRKSLDALGQMPRQDELARWTFCPNISEQTLKARLALRRGTADVRVLVVSIEALDRRIGIMPALPGRWFEVLRGQKVLDRAKEVLTDHLESLHKELDDFRVPPELTQGNRQWVTTLELDVHLEPQSIAPIEGLFAALGGPQKMSGRQELHKVGRCLDWLYPDELDRAVMRDAEASELERLLAAPDRRPVLLIGPPRVGKTAIVHEVVHRRVKEAKNPHVSHQNTWLLGPQRLISGMSYVGQWESRVLAIFKEAARHDHVLYFEDVLGLYFAGISRDSDLTVAHILKPYVERREFRVLAKMTPEAFRILQERDRGMADLFHVIPVRPPGEADTRRVLVNVIRQLEGRHRCRFDLEVLPTVLELSNRYQREYAQPGKSVLFLRQLASANGGQDIGRAAGTRRLSRRQRLSVTFLDNRSRLKREEIIQSLREQVTAQDEAVDVDGRHRLRRQGPAQRHRAAAWHVPVPRPHRRRQNAMRQSACPLSVQRRKTAAAL